MVETEQGKSVKLFYCYAREDKVLREKIEQHLSALRRTMLVTRWCDREIRAGTNWMSEIDVHLNTADIVLLLVNPDFLFSDYCYGIEMQRALERHHQREAHVIPILLRPVDLVGTPIASLQMLPSDARPLTLWNNIDEALREVAIGVREVVTTMKEDEKYTRAALLGSIREESIRQTWTTTTLAKSLNPYYDYTAVRDLSMFFGREKELQALYTAIEHRQCSSITGLRRMGKSSMLKHLHKPALQHSIWKMCSFLLAKGCSSSAQARAIPTVKCR